MNEWLVEVNGKRYPAPDFAMLVQWVRHGRIDPSSAVFDPTLGTWGRAGDNEQLSKHFAAVDARGLSATQWIANIAGEQYRAPSVDVVRRWAAENRIDTETSLFDPRTRVWTKAAAIPDLQDVFAGNPTPERVAAAAPISNGGTTSARPTLSVRSTETAASRQKPRRWLVVLLTVGLAVGALSLYDPSIDSGLRGSSAPDDAAKSPLVKPGTTPVISLFMFFVMPADNFTQMPDGTLGMPFKIEGRFRNLGARSFDHFSMQVTWYGPDGAELASGHAYLTYSGGCESLASESSAVPWCANGEFIFETDRVKIPRAEFERQVHRILRESKFALTFEGDGELLPFTTDAEKAGMIVRSAVVLERPEPRGEAAQAREPIELPATEADKTPSVRSLLVIGELALRAEEWSDAERAFTSVLATGRDDAPSQDDRFTALIGRGMALASQGKPSDARECFREAAELDPASLEGFKSNYMADRTIAHRDEILACLPQ